jgi:hypothetical protein
MSSCRVPRRAALIVILAVALSACDPFATKGTVPPPPPGGGAVDPRTVPDYVAAWNRDGTAIAGYVPKACLFPGAQIVSGTQDSACPVFAEDLRTLVGHMVPGRGFVPLGVDPGDVATFPVVTAPSAAP